MGVKRYIQTLGPYQSLALLTVPTATVEPLKLVAVAIAGAGHWITGAAMIVASYALSFIVVERLFVIVKPKLLTISWFARIWQGFVRVRTKVLIGCKSAIGGSDWWRNRNDVDANKGRTSASLLLAEAAVINSLTYPNRASSVQVVPGPAPDSEGPRKRFEGGAAILRRD